MTLNNFMQPKKKPQVSLKTALRRMRGLWLKGEVSRFDLKLSRVLEVSLERAAEVRETWENLGFLCYNRRGLLCWRNRSF